MNMIAPSISLREQSLFGDCAITQAVNALATAGVEERGAVFTRKEVVDFILDLSGYTADRPLHTMRLLEPSFGDGDFLFPSIDRLLASWRRAGQPDPLQSLAPAIKAVELHRTTFESTCQAVTLHLVGAGLSKTTADALVSRWLTFGDFLLTDIRGRFDVIVGNPPYVRQEMIADALMGEYRARYSTIYDRADLYVPFIERSLDLLSDDGQLGFICSDRWMKNKYGGPLRRYIANGFHLKIYVDMVDTPAFLSDVVAYPAITIFTRQKSTFTRVSQRPVIEPQHLSELSDALTDAQRPTASSNVREVTATLQDGSPWILDSSDELDLVRRLEATFPSLEQAGCKVGIGVATGADKAFIGAFDSLEVEPSRKLPVVMTKDINKGTVAWRGLGVINPFGDDGRLVDLASFPKLKAYLEARRDQIAGRHVAQKLPANWYRTIDRIYPEIAVKPKLLIPDIKGVAHIVFENQGLYPHHNLYFITSDQWDLHALQAVLVSGIARLFVATYSTKMRGGYLRFQAQYLRRIRVPMWSDVPDHLKAELIRAGRAGNVREANRAVFALYGLSDEEMVALERGVA